MTTPNNQTKTSNTSTADQADTDSSATLTESTHSATESGEADASFASAEATYSVTTESTTQSTNKYAENYTSTVSAKTTSSIIDLADISAITSLMPLTFATSNYKRAYNRPFTAPLCHDLFEAVENIFKLYANRVHISDVECREQILEKEVNAAMEQITEQAFKLGANMQSDVGVIAEYLWTSSKKHHVVNDLELSAVLNAVIRDDIAEEIKAAVPIFRSIASRRRVRRDNAAAGNSIPHYPAKGETWRGGGFRPRYRAFFERMIGRKYRVPGFLSTSENRQIAAAFAFKAGNNHPSYPCVIWRITFDPRGKLSPKYRVRHMTYVSNTLNPGEDEYLFAPYSVFTLVSVKWSATKLMFPHEFTIHAHLTNTKEDECLPLTPWY